jgi:PAS domain S-box-containing protein
LCSEDDEPLANDLITEKVQDYLIKGQIQSQELMRTMRNAVARKISQELTFTDGYRAQVTLNSIGDSVICTDHKWNITYLNPIAESMTGWSLKEVAGRPLTKAFCIFDAGLSPTAAEPIMTAIGEDLPYKLPVDCILVRRDGHQLFIEDSVAPIRDSLGSPARVGPCVSRRNRGAGINVESHSPCRA